jgi:adenylate cyclase
VIGEKGDISPRQKESLKLFSRAIDAYLHADFHGAFELLRELQAREPGDAISALYISRCEEFIRSPPGPNWKGYHEYTPK